MSLSEQEQVDAAISKLEYEFASIGDAQDIWLIVAGVLVFFMHAGFAMLEAGSVKETSVTNIMFKNIGTISIGAVFYWLFGWGLAYGSETDGYNSFIGYSGYTTEKIDIGNGGGKSLWFFQMVFAATAATIVSGAVAGRIKLEAYFFVAVLLTGFIYPVVSHWIWATGGWLSAFTPTEDLFTSGCGMLDYAGSGVVHLTGGVAAFWGAFTLGPRAGWTKEEGIPAHNMALVTLGTFILWFGWFGFNCGSTLTWDSPNAGHVAVTTTLSPSAACVTGMIVTRILKKKWDLGVAVNCVLGGLVSITAGCSTLTAGLAVLTGMIGALVYIGSSKLMKKIGVDDPVDAIAVHGFCGIWGVIATGLFFKEKLLLAAYSGRECDTSVGSQLKWQLLGLIAIIGWVSAFSIVIFQSLKALGKLKLSEEEQKDLDSTEHGAAAYNLM